VTYWFVNSVFVLLLSLEYRLAHFYIKQKVVIWAAYIILHINTALMKVFVLGDGGVVVYGGGISLR
jgi:hypothetical protein